MRKYDIGFYSSADRGLDCLLDMIPKIEEKLGRKVTSCWAYGFQTWDAMHSQNPAKMREKWQLIRKMHDVGMENKDRLSHEDLATLMQDTKVWAYPTEFTEIHCITALKAVEAGCYPVTTGVAALAETAPNGTTVDCDDIYSNKEKQQEFIDAVVAALSSDPVEVERVPNRYWTDVAEVWSGVCD